MEVVAENGVTFPTWQLNLRSISPTSYTQKAEKKGKRKHAVTHFASFMCVFLRDSVCNKQQQTMCEVKEPKIMLFGATIQPHQHPPSSSSSHSILQPNYFITDHDQQSPQNISVPKEDHAKKELKDSIVTGSIVEDSNAPCADSDAGSLKISKAEEDQNETSTEEKTLKKPDRILLCPRCNSMDTKFCYFNNYNVNQPRHFCKNCQRYWTAGGTMRNVPVGAGRRKNKNLVAQFRHLSVPKDLQNALVDLPNGIHHPALSPTGTLLTFGSDSPLSESMASALNIVETNGFHEPEERGALVSDGGKENRDDHSSSKEEIHKPEMMSNCQTFSPPWPYSVHYNSSSSPPMFGPVNFPVPFYPTTPYWGCAVPGSWPVPWVFPRESTGPSSPTLGKHSRDENSLKPADTDEGKVKDSEKSLWVPKTLRIDDPGEAAKSSIWATLGIKNDSIDGGGLFKAFQYQSKSDKKTHVQETSSVLQANPAALSRSLSFHENS